ncbi:hypothetical protein [Stenotrophomonas maltophilia]|jgi:hypothetical protein|uniref:hypothetical protein n=1 Tax=Stenotrophomonas maltophilia TaxID=40324 RepID=UPI0015EC129B|nr:hypothetical protein [Stenotrophomonas maltophilia]MDV5766024.1 hypothetical protein [Stenotrophomonas maltophilia]
MTIPTTAWFGDPPGSYLRNGDGVTEQAVFPTDALPFPIPITVKLFLESAGGRDADHHFR